MDLRFVGPAILALLVAFLVFPTIRHRIVLRRASNRRNTAYPRRISSKEPFFNTDLIFGELRDREAKQLLKRTNILFQKLKTKTLESYPFGHRNLETCDARNLQHILSAEQSKFGNADGRKVFIPFIGIGIMNTDGEAWVRSRKLITPTFTKTHIADREFFERHYERFLVRVPKDGETVNLKPLFDQLNLDASSEFIFGESFDSQLGGEKAVVGRKFLDAFNDAQFVVGMRLVFGRLASLLAFDHRFKKFEQNCKMLRDYTEQQVERALNRQNSNEKETEKEEPYILVNELAKEIRNKEAITDQLLNVFLAGREAPAIALSNVMFHLARNPTVWTKMRQETKGLKPSDLSFETLKSLRYVQHAINEALRLHPPLPVQNRTCTVETQLPYGGGLDGNLPITVIPGDNLVFNTYTLHRNPEIYGPDVETFQPERWQGLQPGWNYLPFGGGGHRCPAHNLGQFWLSYTIVRLLLDFKEIKNMDPQKEFVEGFMMICWHDPGIIVSLVKE